MIDLYRTLLKTSIAGQLQYRASGAIWLLGGILEPLIFLLVWGAVAQINGGSAGGYSAAQFAGYFIVMMVVDQLTFTWVMHEFQWRVQEGMFSSLLLRPVHPIHGDIADNIAYKLVMLAIIAPTALTLSLLFRPEFGTPPWALLAALPVLVLALLLRFFMGWTIALFAFWTTRTNAINHAWFTISMVFAGRMAPMALFPDRIRDIAEATPFYWSLAFPVELLLGRIEPADAARGAIIQLAWALLWLLLLRTFWRSAVKRYAAVGG